MPIDRDGSDLVFSASAAAQPARVFRERGRVSDGLVLYRDSTASLQAQIFTFFRESILKGRLRRGRRLPSSRELAAEQGISRTTVVEAFERLESEGYIITRPRIGLFVADTLPEDILACGRSRAYPTRHEEAFTSAAANEPDLRDHQLPLAAGVPALDQFPWSAWSKLSNDVLRSHTTRVIGSADPRGELALREAIAEYLGAARGIDCSPDQIIVTSGSQPVVEAVARALAEPGDSVWVEEPGDPASRAAIKALGMRPVAVPVDAEGLDVTYGRRLAPGARLALVATSHHYPLGVTMSLERRHALLAWAAACGAKIIENEIDGDYRFERNSHPSLFALDETGRTLYLGSFNKTLAPGLRIGYVVVPAELVRALTPPWPMVGVHQQLLLARFWAEGGFVSHLRHLREVHARRRALLIEALQQEAGDVVRLAELPAAGLRLPVVLDRPDGEIASACRAAGLGITRPLSACYASVPQVWGLVLGFASTSEELIRPAVRMLADVIRRSRKASTPPAAAIHACGTRRRSGVAPRPD